ncbi:hypothetical protein GIB67_033812 [Kingdonia uniflora]|uniref:Phosphatidylinositol-specific phospholipase C X domain-containing protein n=1 Tax=Kingdonia uniflora TaxID=39325 RepID=A0A7J7LIB9_9MAGN|nr:hypothetical protein GIB67_033812 [Kingdonia uniflora]
MTPIPLIKCQRFIKEYAFTAPLYPVVITLEDQLTSGLQAKVVEMVTQAFGEMSFYFESVCLEEFPSPEALIWQTDGYSSKHNQDEEDIDDCDCRFYQLGAPEYKRLIFIHAKKYKGGLKESLKIDIDKVGQLSLSEQVLEKATLYHGNNLAIYSVLIRVYQDFSLSIHIELGDAVTLKTLAKAYAQIGVTIKTESMILEMQNVNVRPSERTCGIIVSGYSNERNIKDALRFVYRMNDLGMQPNLVVFNFLIKGFVDITDTDGVDEVLGLMQEQRVKPDVFTFSTIMNMWSATKLMDRCQAIFDDMVETGIEPNIHLYGMLAKGYVHVGELKKAESLLMKILELGFYLDDVLFTTVIIGWCSSGKMEKAISYEKMHDFGISPNLTIFNTLIWGYK